MLISLQTKYTGAMKHQQLSGIHHNLYEIPHITLDYLISRNTSIEKKTPLHPDMILIIHLYDLYLIA